MADRTAPRISDDVGLDEFSTPMNVTGPNGRRVSKDERLPDIDCSKLTVPEGYRHERP